MKAKIHSFLLILGLFTLTSITPQRSDAQVSVSFQVFYDDLSPYGNWVNNSDYGYVWVPDVDAGFSPYSTNGYWVFTSYGWTWVSNYSWGWAPFHYGRWFYEPYYGWMWVPDNEWGPGWVSWRRSDDYYGWAPIRPGISIDIAYSSAYDLPYDRWTFVRNRDFGRTNINNYYINNSTNVTIINNTTVINNINVDRTRNVRYNAGPDRTEAEKHAGRVFTPVAIRENDKPAQRLNNGKLEIYRPRVEKNINAERKPAPTRIVDLKDVKTPGQRTIENKQQRRTDQLDEQKQQQQQRNDQLDRQKQDQQERNKQLDRQKQDQQQRNNQLDKQKRDQQQQNNQLEKQKQDQQQRNNQLEKQKQDQQQRNNQLEKQKQDQQQRNNQLEKQKQDQQQRNNQLEKQKQQQDQRNNQLIKQKQEQQQQNNKPDRQKQQQQKQPAAPPVKGPPAEQQKNEPPGKKGKGIELSLLMILPFIIRKRSISVELFIEALRNENKGDFEAATVAYENALIEEKRTRFSSNDLKNKIIDKLKVLHNMIEYKNNISIIRKQTRV